MAKYIPEEYAAVCGALDKGMKDGAIAMARGVSRSYIQRLGWIHGLRQVEAHFKVEGDIPDEVIRELNKAAGKGDDSFGKLWTTYLEGRWDQKQKPAPLATEAAVFNFENKTERIVIVAPSVKAARLELKKHTDSHGYNRRLFLTSTTPLTVSGILISTLK